MNSLAFSGLSSSMKQGRGELVSTLGFRLLLLETKVTFLTWILGAGSFLSRVAFTFSLK